MARKLITKEIREEILRRNKEESLTIKYLCKEYGFYYTSFFNHLKRNNIQTDVITNKSKINHYYFSEIDTEEKAYFLGLLFADGYLEASNKYNNGRISLKLANPDIYMIKKFRDVVCPELKVRIIKAHINKNGMNCKEAGEVSLISKQLNKDLNNLGMLYGKSKLGRKLPKLNKDLYRHFIRGYFDGDGCIHIRKQIKTKGISLVIYCPDNSFLESIQKYVGDSKIIKGNKFNTVYALYLTNTLNKYNFLNYIYNDSFIYLERKYNLFKSLNFDGRYFY